MSQASAKSQVKAASWRLKFRGGSLARQNNTILCITLNSNHLNFTGYRLNFPYDLLRIIFYFNFSVIGFTTVYYPIIPHTTFK
ncbi:hypothetical protein ACTG2T_13215 [Aeromonas sp. 75A]|uniref:hypothetical protein n=1 Tax=unclassified Aeromonas TaxID=257493 RepID=UPI002E7B5E61|nr:hypothetical protein [Aeromonas sp. 43P]MEE1954723.1 hypothetical protein [Aeromonas sp. 43P]